MDASLLHAFWTVLVLVAFLLIVWWVYVKRCGKDFENAARLPFDAGELSERPDDGEPADQQHREADNRA